MKILRHRSKVSLKNISCQDGAVIIKDVELKDLPIETIQNVLKQHNQNHLRFEFCSFIGHVRIESELKGQKEEDRLEIGERYFKIDLSIEFFGCIFQERVNFTYIIFRNGLGLYRTEFFKKVDFSGSIFEKLLTFFDVNARQGISFFDSSLSEVSLEECSFQGKLNFSSSKFEKEFLSRHIQFEGVDFSKAKFKRTVLFDKCRFDKELILEDNTFEDQYNFCFIICSFGGDITLDSTSENKICDVKEVKQEENTNKYLRDSINKRINEYFQFETQSYYKQRDFMRRIKSNRLMHHDMIGASNFQAKELNMKKEELNAKKELNGQEKIEKHVLKFFYAISNYHTDYLRILYSFSWVVVLFSSFYILIFLCFGPFVGCHTCIDIQWWDISNAIKKVNECAQWQKSWEILLFNFFLSCLYILVHWLVFVCFQQKIGYIKTIFNRLVVLLSFLIICLFPQVLTGGGIFFLKGLSLSNPFSVLGALYTVIYGLIIYSLVKTAQKNTKLS